MKLIFISVFLLLYGLLNYYIGLRGWQAFGTFGKLPLWIWILLVIFLAVLFPVGRLAANLLPREIARIIIYAGSYWMAMIYYLLLIVLVVDIIRVINHWTGVIPQYLYKSPALVGAGVILLVLLIVIYGAWNADHPVVRDYEVTVNKMAGTTDEMRIVAVSDIHLGWIVGIERMADMVNTINSLKPDLVIMVGDIIDEGVDPAAERKIPEILGTLDPRFGVYAVLGNHEYISNNVATTINYLQQAGIHVLRDQAVEVPNSFILVGRDDQACKHYTGKERQALSTIMTGIDRDHLPIILLDHEPVDLEAAVNAGVDLQFSGHTHLGQLYPNNFITRSIYEDDWGYLKKGNLQVIVSCGFGTWGPPIRIGNHPEILNVRVKFKP